MECSHINFPANTVRNKNRAKYAKWEESSWDRHVVTRVADSPQTTKTWGNAQEIKIAMSWPIRSSPKRQLFGMLFFHILKTYFVRRSHTVNNNIVLAASDSRKFREILNFIIDFYIVSDDVIAKFADFSFWSVKFYFNDLDDKKNKIWYFSLNELLLREIWVLLLYYFWDRFFFSKAQILNIIKEVNLINI